MVKRLRSVDGTVVVHMSFPSGMKVPLLLLLVFTLVALETSVVKFGYAKHCKFSPATARFLLQMVLNESSG